jgi:hypothetical protein
MFLKKLIQTPLSDLVIGGRNGKLVSSIEHPRGKVFNQIRAGLKTEEGLKLIAEKIYEIELTEGDGALDYWHVKFFLLLNNIGLSAKLLKAIDEVQKNDSYSIRRMGLKKTSKIIYYMERVLEGRGAWKPPLTMSPKYINSIKNLFAE